MKKTCRTAVLAICALASHAAAQTVISDDFESYSTGAFPAPDWLDVAEVPDPPLAPVPSCLVETTTGPDGQPTQAVSTIEFMGAAQGFYRFVPLSKRYIVSADVRVDRFVDRAYSEVSDWTWEVGVGQYVPGEDFCCTPQVGIYGSAFTQGWRLFVVGTGGAYADIDLEVPVDIGRWYHVEMDLDAVTGAVRSRIADAATGEQLCDRLDVIAGWTDADGKFDVVNFFESDYGDDATESNLCVIDNVKAIVYGEQPCRADFNGDGVVNTADFVAFLNGWADAYQNGGTCR